MNVKYSSTRIYTCKTCHRLIEIDYYGKSQGSFTKKSQGSFTKTYYLDCMYKTSTDHFTNTKCPDIGKGDKGYGGLDVIICQ